MPGTMVKNWAHKDTEGLISHSVTITKTGQVEPRQTYKTSELGHSHLRMWQPWDRSAYMYP